MEEEKEKERVKKETSLTVTEQCFCVPDSPLTMHAAALVVSQAPLEAMHCWRQQHQTDAATASCSKIWMRPCHQQQGLLAEGAAQDNTLSLPSSLQEEELRCSSWTATAAAEQRRLRAKAQQQHPRDLLERTHTQKKKWMMMKHQTHQEHDH